MHVYLGIDIGATFVKYGVIDPDGHILYSSRTSTRGNEGREAAVGAIVGTARELVAWSRSAGHTPLSIGVGSPGTINPTTHVVQPPSPNIMAIIGVDFVTLITGETGLPVAIDNDANCAAWAEHVYGAARGIKNLICLTVGSGIGSGFIIDGRIHTGPTGSGGELGHVTIDWQGNRCPCGNRGCLETYVSANSLMRRAGDAARSEPGGMLARHLDPQSNVPIGDLFKSAAAGDRAARQICDESALQFALGILSAVNVLDPEAIIIGGGAADADHTHGSHWLAAIGDNVRHHAFSDAGKSLRVGRAVLGNDAGFIGAAALGALLVDGKSD